MANKERSGSVAVKFDIKNPQFVISLLIALFSGFTLIDIQLPSPAEVLANEAVTIFTTGGTWSLLGWLVSSFSGVVVLIYQKWKSKELNFSGLAGNVNLWLLVASIGTAFALRFGINIPAGALGDLVQQIYAGSYLGAAGIFISQILNPLIRFIQSKRTTADQGLTK